MTAQETGKIIDILIAAYPNFKPTKQTAILWAQMFVDDPVEMVASGVKAYIATDTTGFAPAIGQIKQLIAKAKAEDAMTEGEAWALIRKAIGNGLYGADAEFKKLPPILQRIVGEADQLTRWAMLTDGLDTVVASNVQRSYRKALEQEQFRQALPSDVKAVLTSSQLFLEGNNG